MAIANLELDENIGFADSALEQLGRDTIDAVVWPMSEEEAVLLDRSLRLSEHETALEVGWLLAELELRFGYGLDELARRFDRSVSWVSRRLALVEVLPEAIQRQVREGQILAQVAMKFLVPVARQSLEVCQRMAAIFAGHGVETRDAGLLYAAWRQGSSAIRKRILAAPELFFKAQRQACETVPAGLVSGSHRLKRRPVRKRGSALPPVAAGCATCLVGAGASRTIRLRTA